MGTAFEINVAVPTAEAEPEAGAGVGVGVGSGVREAAFRNPFELKTIASTEGEAGDWGSGDSIPDINPANYKKTNFK